MYFIFIFSAGNESHWYDSHTHHRIDFPRTSSVCNVFGYEGIQAWFEYGDEFTLEDDVQDQWGYGNYVTIVWFLWNI